jgi:DNA-binding MarR family transcriptional regulator
MREGGTRLEVLAAVASLERDRETPPRQKDITDLVSVTRGTVSKTCSTLVDEGQLLEDDGEYRVNEEMLLLIYKEHLESYLVRDSANNGFADLVEARNEIRLDLKGELRQLVADDEDGRRDLMVNILREVLVYALSFREIQTLRDYLFAVDHLVRTLAAHVATNQNLDESDVAHSDALRLLLLVAVVLDRGYAMLARLRASHTDLGEFLPGEPPEDQMIRYLTTQ